MDMCLARSFTDTLRLCFVPRIISSISSLYTRSVPPPRTNHGIECSAVWGWDGTRAGCCWVHGLGRSPVPFRPPSTSQHYYC